MANTIQIKRANTTTVPAALASGEPAYTQINGTLWIGRPSDNLVMPIVGPNNVKTARAASTANVSTTYTATSGTYSTGQHTGCPNTLDGVTLAAGDRVLLKNQTTGAQNGIFVVTTLGTGANGVWDRVWDWGSAPYALPGVRILVGPEGTANANTEWACTNVAGYTIGGASGSTLTFANVWASQTTVGTITAGAWNGTAIASQYGGTGLNTSASTGVPSVSSGTWSVNATLGNTLGGTGQNSSAWTGVPSVSAGVWSSNAQLPVSLGGTGAGTLTGLVKGNGTGAMTAAVAGTDYCAAAGGSSIATVGTITTGVWNGTAIAAQYGGTGQNSSAWTGVPSVSAGVWSSNAQLPVSLGGTGVGTLTGLVKASGTSAFSAAVAGTDYLSPSSTIDGGTF